MADQPPKELSKAEQKKLAKKAKKAAAKAATGGGQQQQPGEDLTKYAHLFGDRPLVEPEPKTPEQVRKYTLVQDLTTALDGQKVLVRARVHRSRKASAALCFIFLRHRYYTVQVVVEEQGDTVPKAMVNWASKLKTESIVDVVGTVRKATVEAASQKEVELSAVQIYRVSNAERLPILVDDCARPEPALEAQRQEIALIEKELLPVLEEMTKETDAEKKKALQVQIDALTAKKSSAAKIVDIDQSTRLDNRVIDLRVPAHVAIFKVQSGVCQLFREFLYSRQFTEIHSPKLIGAASEGGADVFEVKYFKTKAFLAQSPQLYKQMAICGDFERVFEIGPVFRAEQSNTHRHLTEFTGLDLEMAIQQHYHEVTDVLGDLFVHIFEGLELRYKKELEVISQQYPFEPIKYLKKTLRLTFPEGVKLVREAGGQIGDFDDLSTANERLLGKVVREKYNTDFFILDQYPSAVRPFYTMANPEDKRYSNSYDMFIRGEEICSGAQRVHDAKILEAQARERGVDLATIKPYLDSFTFGISPHGGGGVGLERVVMLALNIHNVRKSSLFPRDPQRLTP